MLMLKVDYIIVIMGGETTYDCFTAKNTGTVHTMEVYL